MKKYTLTGKDRIIVGKKSKSLRSKGELPSTIYGKNLKSISISVAKDAFESVYKQAGETGLIELSIESEKHPVLIHTVQIDPVSSAILHIEFHQVDLKEKVHAKIPIKVSGDSPAVSQKLGVLLTVHDSVEVEAFPTDLPDHIIVDVSGLAEVNQEFTIGDLTLPPGVSLLSDAKLTVVKVGPLVTREAEAQAAAEAAQAAEAAAATEGAAAPSADQPAAQPPLAEAAPKTTPPEKK